MAGLYLHIPFCERKCSYCDFYSIVAPPLHDACVEAMIKELAMRRREILNCEINTVYFGGGTPSILTPDIVEPLLCAVTKVLDNRAVKEFTVEMNPESVTREKIEIFKRYGCNRISLGVQSMVDEELAQISRIHSVHRVERAVDDIVSAGIHNYNLDLMFGLPGQTLDSLQYSIDKLMSMHPMHISCYGLMYEPGTLVYRMREDGRMNEVDDDTYTEMYNMVVSSLKRNGFVHYEISNFARPGFESLHNSSYWNGEPYIGIGPAAYSYDGDRLRRNNIANVRKYITAIENGTVYFEEEFETDVDFHNDYILTRLRTNKGILIDDYVARFGLESWKQIVEKSTKWIDAMKMTHSNSILAITEQGFLISDQIISDLFE